MRELRPGVSHRQSSHPDWDAEEWWPELVSSYGIELGDDFVLFDPLAVPDELRERATAVVLTAPYHERDARRLGLPVHTPPADTWEDWVEKFGVDPERVRGMESRGPCLAARGRRRRTFLGSRSVAVRHHCVRGSRGQRSHPLAAVDQRDCYRRLALRLRRRTGHPARRSQARDARRHRPTAPSAASTFPSNLCCPRTASRRIARRSSACSRKRRRQEFKGSGEHLRPPAPVFGNVPKDPLRAMTTAH